MGLTLTLLLILAAPVGAQNAVRKEESTDTIIERLKKNPSDYLWVGELAQRSDPQVIPALRELFIKAKLSGATGEDGTAHFPDSRGKFDASRREGRPLLQ